MSVQFKQTQLDNGLTIVAEPNNATHTAAVGFFVKTGTRDETLDQLGVSHYLEHMVFKGTANRTAEQVNIDFDKIGANYNAMTSQETTTYFAHVLPHFMPQAIDILADILRPSLRDEDFQMEKQVILEEIGMYSDRPFWVAYEQCMEQFFGNHTLGYRILGTNDSITALTSKQMTNYFNQRYSPDNIVVSLTGHIDFDQCVDQIQQMCGSWKQTGAKRDFTTVAGQSVDETIKDEKVTRHYIVSVCQGPSRQDEMRYEAAVLCNLLGDVDGSRLYWNLIEKGLADEAEISTNPFDKTGTYLIYASCDPQRSEQVEQILMQTIDNVATDLTSDEVERARNKIAMDITLENERLAGRMLSLGGTWLYTGQYRSLDKELKHLNAVDVDSIRQLLERFSFQPRSTVRLTPEN